MPLEEGAQQEEIQVWDHVGRSNLPAALPAFAASSVTILAAGPDRGLGVGSGSPSGAYKRLRV